MDPGTDGPCKGIRLKVANFYTLLRMRKGANNTLVTEADSRPHGGHITDQASISASHLILQSQLCPTAKPCLLATHLLKSTFSKEKLHTALGELGNSVFSEKVTASHAVLWTERGKALSILFSQHPTGVTALAHRRDGGGKCHRE